MISALVLINVQRGQVNETAQALLEIDGVAEVYSVTGEYDLVALLRLQHYEDLADVVTTRMVNLPAIRRLFFLPEDALISPCGQGSKGLYLFLLPPC